MCLSEEVDGIDGHYKAFSINSRMKQIHPSGPNPQALLTQMSRHDFYYSAPAQFDSESDTWKYSLQQSRFIVEM